jgi:putative permease
MINLQYMFVLSLIVFLIKDIFFALFISVMFAIGLNPVINLLESKLKINRFFSSLISVFVLFYSLFIIISTLIPFFDKYLIPVILNLDKLSIVINAKEMIIDFIDTKFQNTFSAMEIMKNFHRFGISSSISEWIIAFIMSVFGSIKTIISSVLSFFLYVPLITFFLLKDKEIIISFFKSFLSKNSSYKYDILRISIYNEMQEYLKRQFFVTAILSIYYGSISYFCDLFFIFGIVIGIISIIPYLGFVINLILVFVISFAYEIPHPYLFISLFLLGVFIESMFLIPVLFFHKVHSLYLLIFMVVFQNFVSISFLFLAMPICVLSSAVFRSFELFYKRSIDDERSNNK